MVYFWVVWGGVFLPLMAVISTDIPLLGAWDADVDDSVQRWATKFSRYFDNILDCEENSFLYKTARAAKDVGVHSFP